MKERSEKLSIVLPFHNSQRFIKRTLKCLLSQSYKDFEIFLVNDFSNDNSVNIINEFNDSRITIIENNGKGAVDAYNTGFSVCNSKFIFIADHDDLFDSQLIEKEYKFLINNKDISIVSSSYHVIDKIGEIIHKVTLPSNDVKIKGKMKYQCSINNSGSMIRESFFEKYGGFKNHFSPAHDF